MLWQSSLRSLAWAAVWLAGWYASREGGPSGGARRGLSPVYARPADPGEPFAGLKAVLQYGARVSLVSLGFPTWCFFPSAQFRIYSHSGSVIQSRTLDYIFYVICFLLFKKKLSVKCLTQYLGLNRPRMNVVSRHPPPAPTSQSGPGRRCWCPVFI